MLFSFSLDHRNAHKLLIFSHSLKQEALTEFMNKNEVKERNSNRETTTKQNKS